MARDNFNADRENLTALEDYARREEKAHAFYQRQYQRQYPAPSKPAVYRKMTGLSWIFLLIALAGSALAATRTVPVFVDIAKQEFDTLPQEVAVLIGLLALIVVDAGAILFRFASVYIARQRESDPPPITVWVRRGALFALITQLIAQFYGVRDTVSWLPPEVKDGMELIIASAAALSGMVLAFVTGEILAVLALQAQHDTTAARLDYEADMAVWRDNLAQSWKADRGRLIGAAPRADTRRSAAAPAQTDTRRRRPDRQDAPPSPTELKALRFLSQRSDADQLTVRQLAALAGVNRDASSKALQRWRQGVSVPVSERQNGHGEGVEDE